ncbi:succinyl-diaminopimelate desuccinylase [Methylocystis sp. MJC1]|jgi:succinyl-diaminopimelate desuccinylase|uniref:succinyl-diaminopimelate desuccinylase n=1 Tax=Methylocystis sp. MJC1 TaxID=2654282 RepID=UPI0013EDF852|nr:succinyl-diaminopimelate desuccinylase [Methylocystis sp. MJC1]KAF2990318.1 Succinyl-diaminopimelate desuccinylase [Methylocystis sp. MJC1]MBU6528117.1 succinyl-diaminopimelate desuccinylase [Methylocystis sp. MJC1]UZX11032.1 succinyl-diaminopimelate desuccinylase [Methylocystis sp. MJC1]
MPLSRAVSLSRDLIRCPSVTPADAGALDIVARELKTAGFETHRLRFTEPGTPDVDNLFAKIGAGAPHLVFAGHTDVVPAGDVARWSADPFAGEIVDGRIVGRGASDMKGAIGAFMAAALSYVARHGAPRGTISFLITGDEEGPSINGTVKMLDWARARGEKFDHAIVGEPTNVSALGDTIKIGRRGSLNGKIRVIGKQGHVAYPHRTDNPVPAIARIVSALSSYEFDRGTAHFDPTNLEVSSIDVGNPAVNVIPAEARAQFNVRFNDAWTLETLRERIAAVVTDAAGPARVELEFLPSNAVSFLTEPGAFTALVSAAVTAVTGLTPELSTSGGTSDARFITRHCPVVEFGLTNETIHAVDENARVADIEALAAVYEKILDAYFSG